MHTRKLAESVTSVAALYVLALELKESLRVPGNIFLGKSANHYHQKRSGLITLNISRAYMIFNHQV
jgi:hypothetical protein